MSFLDADDKVLNGFHLWKKLKIGCVEVSIQVLPEDSRAVIAKKHTIWVHHRNDVKVVVVSEYRNLEYSRDETLQCKIRDSLSRMSPC